MYKSNKYDLVKELTFLIIKPSEHAGKEVTETNFCNCARIYDNFGRNSCCETGKNRKLVL